MIRPTSIPQTLEDLWLEQAVCREALRLSLSHHRSLAVGLSGAQQKRGIADIFSQRSNRYELVDMMKLDVVIGSGGVLSHAPHRLGAALMMMDGFGLAGLTQISVDSIFMMPHLGVFASVHPEASHQIFQRDCIVNIAHAVVPVWHGKNSHKELCDVYLNGTKIGVVTQGRVEVLRIDSSGVATLKLEPRGREIDLGAGKGKVLTREITIGFYGLILDGRNRPIEMPVDRAERARAQGEIFDALSLR